ncbi:unnamed protein product [Cylindrotheca closterium]|uniref:Uncharacterized protein n=1 Tax=Cylindrotheca closterium TaxID=2856 RepID=A0AAD2GEV1_9STRA|nr:unnamed protein product [Cylindrotheca closterium]
MGHALIHCLFCFVFSCYTYLSDLSLWTKRLVPQEGNKEELDKIEASIAKAKIAHTELQDDSGFFDAMPAESRKAYTDHLEDWINANMAVVKKSQKKPLFSDAASDSDSDSDDSIQ